MKRIVVAALAVLVLRWATLEVAAHAARNWLPRDDHQRTGEQSPGYRP